MDRYVYSGVAYTTAKGVDIEWAMAPDRGLPQPDLIIFLDVDVTVSMGRGQFGEERYEKEEFQKSTRRVFKELEEREKKRDSAAVKWVSVPADQSVDQLHNALATQVEKCLDMIGNTEISKITFT